MNKPLTEETPATTYTSLVLGNTIPSLQELLLLKLTDTMDLNSILLFCAEEESRLNIIENSISFWKVTFVRLFEIYSVIQRPDLTTGPEWYQHVLSVNCGIVYKMTLHVVAHNNNIIAPTYSVSTVHNWQYTIPFEIKGLRPKPGVVYVGRILSEISDLADNSGYGRPVTILDKNGDGPLISEFFMDKNHAVAWITTETIRQITNQSDGINHIDSYTLIPDNDINAKTLMKTNDTRSESLLMAYIKLKFELTSHFSLDFIIDSNSETRAELDIDSLKLNFRMLLAIEQADFI